MHAVVTILIIKTLQTHKKDQLGFFQMLMFEHLSLPFFQTVRSLLK